MFFLQKATYFFKESQIFKASGTLTISVTAFSATFAPSAFFSILAISAKLEVLAFLAISAFFEFFHPLRFLLSFQSLHSSAFLEISAINFHANQHRFCASSVSDYWSKKRTCLRGRFRFHNLRIMVENRLTDHFWRWILFSCS